jgi:hypothetical protein
MQVPIAFFALPEPEQEQQVAISSLEELDEDAFEDLKPALGSNI